MEKFGGKEQPKKRRDVLRAGLAALGFAAAGMTELPPTPAEAFSQTSRNSPNIVNNGGHITIDMNGSGGGANPNVQNDGSIHQESSGSPNIIVDKEKGTMTIDGKVFPMKK